ncbi:MAG: polyamine aminopropyltransferase, partial [Gammaproteobacteria bacterium]|nr:polyamine aminopropyltransferase [Gammaproteobacteria bacterium]
MSELAASENIHIELDNYQNLSQRQVVVLLISITIVALCGITYELIIGAVSSYLLGNSVYQFSLTIGFFMFAMGLGSYFSKLFLRNLLANFVWVEIAISIIGGLCSLSLFIAFSGVHALYTPIMYFFIIVIGTLVGLEIPLLTRILSQKEMIRKSIANVLSLDYVGALIGSVAFPLLLLPNLGLIRASFAIGLINIATAIINLYYFRDHLKHARALVIGAVLTLIVLVALILFGTRLSSFAEHHLYMDQVVFSEQTPYQKVIFTQSPANGNYRMYIDGHIQFSQRDEHRYHEALVHPVMSLPGPKENILILGGGDGLAAREVLKYDKVKSITLIDIDPAITSFSASFPALVKMNGDSLNNP